MELWNDVWLKDVRVFGSFRLCRLSAPFKERRVTRAYPLTQTNLLWGHSKVISLALALALVYMRSMNFVEAPGSYVEGIMA